MLEFQTPLDKDTSVFGASHKAAKCVTATPLAVLGGTFCFTSSDFKHLSHSSWFPESHCVSILALALCVAHIASAAVSTIAIGIWWWLCFSLSLTMASESFSTQKPKMPFQINQSRYMSQNLFVFPDLTPWIDAKGLSLALLPGLFPLVLNFQYPPALALHL